jgi:two-component system response regulator DegU
VPERSVTPRVVLVDDHPLYRQGLARLLVGLGIEVVAEAGNGLEAVAAVEEHAPDVVVVDLNMPGMSGLEVTRRLIERAPASRVLVLSVSAQEGDVTEALLAGASGYVLKESPVQEVVAGIQAAAAGESLVSPRIASMLLRKVRDRPSQQADRPPLEGDWPVQEAGAPSTPLTGRELEVLRLVADGKTNDEIGEALHIGERTVRNHMSSILMKLQWKTACKRPYGRCAPASCSGGDDQGRSLSHGSLAAFIKLNARVPIPPGGSGGSVAEWLLARVRSPEPAGWH